MQAFRCPVVVVLGATGAGKSKLALELGMRFNGEIINADSMQVYKGLDIITNKVTSEEQEQCPHHALGMIHPLQRFSVVDYRNRVIPLIDGLLSRGRLPIIVGGTNYYIEALLWKVLLTDENTNSTQKLLFESKGDVETLKLKPNPTESLHKNSFANCERRLMRTRNAETPHGQELEHMPNQSDHVNVRNRDLSSQSNLELEMANNDDQSQSQIDGTWHHLESKAKPEIHCLLGASKGNMNYAKESPQTSEEFRISNQSQGRREVTSHQPELETHVLNAETAQSLEMSNINSNLANKSTKILEKSPEMSKESHSSEDVSYQEGGSVDDGVLEVNVRDMESSQLHCLLRDVDPEMASKLHPNDRRKIIRSLQVYEQHGVPHSDLIKEQRSQDGGSHLGGPLRYPNSCVFWVQAEQSVLDIRLDKRVEKMMNAGLLKELEEFHKDYNEQRLAGNIKEEEQYTQGIFQSIGFKEFHPYLVASEERKKSDEGQRLLEESIERLKTATRQYARRQLKWIRNRFLKRGSNCPPVYGFDATKPEEWDQTVLKPATEVLQAVIEGKDTPTPPLPYEEREVNDLSQTFVCDVCKGRQFVGLQQWKGHLKSRRHQKQARKKRLRELMEKESSKKQTAPSMEESEDLSKS